MNQTRFIIGTCGYSFGDWVGNFYPVQARAADMFDLYARQFSAVELNFTYYRMPAAATMDALARKSPAGFEFWVKANQDTTHKQLREAARPFLEALAPMSAAGKLAGVLLQFPQSFRRTVANRKYLAAVCDDMASVPLAVEFRHCSWQDEAATQSLRERGVLLVVPDVPDLAELYHHAPAATAGAGYFRLHSRDAAKWHAGYAARYDYNYSDAELEEIARGWSSLEPPAEKVYAFFNNCHAGQAAANAQAFARIVREL
ncbi:MAG: DUF72 domain-containing protein [Planctomycetaceae bacterium]|nr:DUF72 domain-containing protein [Planctomycetaceae bacterium]